MCIHLYNQRYICVCIVYSVRIKFEEVCRLDRDTWAKLFGFNIACVGHVCKSFQYYIYLYECFIGCNSELTTSVLGNVDTLLTLDTL